MARFDVSRPGEVAKWFEKGTERAAERAALATAARLVNHIVTEVIPGSKPQPVDRGLYRAGWRYKRVRGGAEVFNTVLHAGFIEYGVRAKSIKIGRAMIDALAAWVRRKGIAGKGKGKGKDARAEARRVAWAIAQKMRRRGIWRGRGLRVLARASVRTEGFFKEELKREVAHGYKR